MRYQIGRVDHGPGQRLIQIGHGGKQALRIGKRPAPPCLLWEDERQAAFFPLAAPLWPEESTDGSGGLTRIRVDDSDPVAVHLLKPGARSGTCECGGWQYPDLGQGGLPQVFKQSAQLAHVRWKQDRAQYALSLDNIYQEHLGIGEDSYDLLRVHDSICIFSLNHASIVRRNMVFSLRSFFLSPCGIGRLSQTSPRRCFMWKLFLPRRTKTARALRGPKARGMTVHLR